MSSLRGFWHRDGFAFFAPAGEIPAVGEAGALEGLDGLNGAFFAVEKVALAVGLVDQ